MSDLDTKAIRERAERATKGPWKGCHNGECACGMIWSEPFDCVVAARIAASDETYTGGEGITDADMLTANASFIAHARTDVPALCDALDDARAELATEQRAVKILGASLETASAQVNELRAELAQATKERDEWKARCESTLDLAEMAADAANGAADERDALRAHVYSTERDALAAGAIEAELAQAKQEREMLRGVLKEAEDSFDEIMNYSGGADGPLDDSNVTRRMEEAAEAISAALDSTKEAA